MTKQHFAGLDGMRGIAAIAVVLLHANQLFNVSTDFTSFYLAVDFFFILSGFVISYAYDRRLDNGLSWMDFMRLRLIRLYPMLFIGIVSGGIVFIGRQIQNHSGQLGQSIILIVLSLLTLPAGLIFGITAYPINNPTWSIFFEIVANMVYATNIRRMPKNIVLCSLIPSSLFLIALSFEFGTIGYLGFIELWSFLSGFFRVVVPFTMGVIIYRTKMYDKFYQLPFIVGGCLLVVTLGLHSSAAWAYDVVAVLVIFPAIVCMGAVSSMGPSTKRFCDLCGRISYPLYLMHQPILRTVDAAYKASHLEVGPVLPMILGVIAAFLVSALLLKFYDEPVRAWLTRVKR